MLQEPLNFFPQESLKHRRRIGSWFDWDSGGFSRPSCVRLRTGRADIVLQCLATLPARKLVSLVIPPVYSSPEAALADRNAIDRIPLA